MAKDPQLLDHQEWLGYLQPVGLVVSPAALIEAQAHVSRDVVTEQQRFLAWTSELPIGQDEPCAAFTDLRGLLCDVFGWQPSCLLGSKGAEPVPDVLSVYLPSEEETLRPTYAVKELPAPNAPQGEVPLLMLIEVVALGTTLDRADEKNERHWKASPQARFERLLRETQVPLGLLVNGIELRLV